MRAAARNARIVAIQLKIVDLQAEKRLLLREASRPKRPAPRPRKRVER